LQQRFIGSQLDGYAEIPRILSKLLGKNNYSFGKVFLIKMLKNTIITPQSVQAFKNNVLEKN